MPTFSSMVDQIATGVLSHVTFVELAYFMSDWRRSMLTTVTNVPTKNIRPTLTFFFQCSFSPGSWERGIANIHKSSPILTAALIISQLASLTASRGASQDSPVPGWWAQMR